MSRPTRAWLTAGAVACACACALPASAAAGTETLRFPAEADTYVTAADPTSTHGTSSGMWVDRSPSRQSFLRFWALGLAGRPVTGARLRLVQRDASRSGGRVFAMSSILWPERTTTWDTRPPIDGALLGSFGAVSAGSTYTAALSPGAVGVGVLSLGMDSPSSDGARWATTESSTPPVLEVDVETPSGFVADGASLVASPKAGSSEPTYNAGNRRLALSSGGRQLAVHGSHLSGVQLAWRDPAGGWQTRTRGATATGGVLTGTGTGDWATSIAVTRDAAGVEQAWVVWSGRSHSARRAVAMRRISELDDPAGPRVGPVVSVDAPEGGAYRADVAFERDTDGTVRGSLLWTRGVPGGSYEVVTSRFSRIGSDTPVLSDRTVLARSPYATRFGTLAATPRGLRAIVREAGGALVVHAHAAGAPADAWSRGAVGPVVSSYSAPSAAGLDSGEVLVAVERDTSAHVAGVYRFSASGTSVSKDFERSGWISPTVATDGSRASVAAVSAGTGHLVSRARSAMGAWSSADRLEIGPEARGRLKYPNALREADGRLRLLVEGPDGSSTQSSVLAYQRPF